MFNLAAGFPPEPTNAPPVTELDDVRRSLRRVRIALALVFAVAVLPWIAWVQASGGVGRLAVVDLEGRERIVLDGSLGSLVVYDAQGGAVATLENRFGGALELRPNHLRDGDPVIALESFRGQIRVAEHNGADGVGVTYDHRGPSIKLAGHDLDQNPAHLDLHPGRAPHAWIDDRCLSAPAERDERP